MKLFGNHIKPACLYCEEAFQQLEGDKVLCMKHGPVSAEHSCRKYRYDPLKRVPHRPRPLEQFRAEDFEL